MKHTDTTTLKGKISVMQAFESGVPVQFRSRFDMGATWQDASVPTWDWPRYDYRAQPKPALPQEWQLQYRPELGAVVAVRVLPSQDVGGVRVREVRE